VIVAPFIELNSDGRPVLKVAAARASTHRNWNRSCVLPAPLSEPRRFK
jgi:hypothetical protein